MKTPFAKEENHLVVDGNPLQTRTAEEKLPENKVQTEETVVYDHDLLKALLDSSPDHIYFKDTRSRFIKSSAAQARQFGVASPDELVGKTDFDILSEEHARLAFEDEQEVVRTGQPIIGKVEKETWKDGRGESWALTTRMPLRNKDGKIIGTFGISKDITGIKQTEAELAYQRDLLGTLMENSPDSIFFKDLQSRFVKISRSEVNHLLRLSLSRYRASHLGDGDDTLPSHLASAEEFEKYVIGKTDADVYGQERAGEFSDDEQEIIRTGMPIVEKSEKSVHPDGHIDWFLTTKGPWRDKNGKIIGTFGTSKNISELKAAQTKIEEVQTQLLATARLAGMAEIATNVLHNVGNVLNSVTVSAGVLSNQVRASKAPGLAKAVQLLDEHAADLGDFLSHDEKGRRLPAYLGKLAQTLAVEQQSLIEELGQLAKSVEHIKDIVATQQAYAGAISVVERVQIQELVEDALHMSAGSQARRGVTVVREFAEVPLLPLDRHRILQILMNLIRNAEQAMEGDTGRPRRMTLRLEMVDGLGGRQLRVSVADEGEGISAENLTRIFSHGFTTRKNGHGFGLHSCALAAREMGGSLTAHSDGVGQGATFVIEIPVDVPKGRP